MADAYSANVVFLAKFNTDGAVSSMLDKLGNAITGYGNSTVVTEGDALTGHYLSLDGTGDYLTITGTSGLLLGSGNFTIDFGVKTSAASTKCLLDFWDGTSSGWQLLMNSSGQLVFGNPGSVLTSNSSINDGSRHHVQISRYSNTLYMHIDGARQTNTATVSTNFNTISPLLSIGAQVTSRNAAWDFPGKMDFLRITVGVARGNGASSITPPTLADLALAMSVSASDTLSCGAYSIGNIAYPVLCADYAQFAAVTIPSPHGQAVDGLGLSGSISGLRNRLGSTSETVGFAGVASARGVFGGATSESIVLSATPQAKSVMSVSLSDGIKVFEAETLAGLIDDALSVWVANVATAAHSRYSHYGFNSFAKFNGKYYGCKSDGIYELDGLKDGAAAIPWTVTFPELDFGTSNLKRFESVYFGVKSTGQLVVKVVQDATNIYHYNVTTSGNDARSARAILGRGLIGRYWQFELASDTERVELDSIDYSLAITSRRV